MPAFDSITGELLRIAAQPQLEGLAIDRARELAPTADWDAFCSLAIEHRIAPLALRSLASLLPAKAAETLRRSALRASQRNLHLCVELVRILDLLRHNGIPAVPFKGPVAAQTLFGDLALRPFGDLDIFVDARDLWSAREILRQAGFTDETTIPARMEADVLRWGCECNFVSPDRSYVLEAHWAIAPKAYALDWPVEPALARTRQVTLSGTSVAAFSPEDDLLMLCMHAAKHAWNTLIWINDIGLAMQRPLDWPSLRKRAKQSGISRICAVSFGLARSLLNHQIPPAAQELFPQDAATAKLVNELATGIFHARREYFDRRDHFAFLRSRERLSDKAAYVWRMASAPDLYFDKPGFSGRVARAAKVVTGSTRPEV